MTKKPQKKPASRKSKSPKSKDESVLEMARKLLREEVELMRSEEIELMKKEILSSVTETVNPFLEALQKIKNEHEGMSLKGSPSMLGNEMPSLEDMQKSAMETMMSSSDNMLNSNDFLKDLRQKKKARLASMIQGLKKKKS